MEEFHLNRLENLKSLSLIENTQDISSLSVEEEWIEDITGALLLINNISVEIWGNYFGAFYYDESPKAFVDLKIRLFECIQMELEELTPPQDDEAFDEIEEIYDMLSEKIKLLEDLKFKK